MSQYIEIEEINYLKIIGYFLLVIIGYMFIVSMSDNSDLGLFVFGTVMGIVICSSILSGEFFYTRKIKIKGAKE